MNIKQFFNQKGQGLSEYALILVLVSVVAIAGISLVGGAVGNTYSNVLCVMDNNDCTVLSSNSSSSSNSGTGSSDTGSSAENNDNSSNTGDTGTGDTSGSDDTSGDTGDSGSGDTSGDTSGGDDTSSGGGGDSTSNYGGGDDSSGDSGSGDSGGSTNTTSGYQYFRLVANSEVNGNPWTSIAELNLVDTDGNTLSKSGWSLHYTDSEETSGENGQAANAFDGNNSTIWHTQWQGGSPGHDHEIQINLGQRYELASLRYLPRQNSSNGRVANYRLYVSENASSWTEVASGTFSDTSNEQVVNLDGSSTAPNVCDSATIPTNSVFHLENFTGSSVSDLSGNGNTATLSGSYYTISNSSAINTGTFNDKTLGVQFTTGSSVNYRQMIYEQGGGTRGINVYLDGATLYVGIWNRSTWDERFVSTNVAPNTDYTVVLVYDNPNVSVYVNDALAGSFNDTGELTSHSGGISVMGNGNSYYHDGGGSGDQLFIGTVSELAQWNTALSGSTLTALQTYLTCAGN